MLYSIVGAFERRNGQKLATNEEKKVFVYQDNTLSHKSIATIAKLLEFLPHLPYSDPSNYWLFADLKRMLQGKRFGFNEEVILETEGYSEAKDKLSTKKALNC